VKSEEDFEEQVEIADIRCSYTPCLVDYLLGLSHWSSDCYVAFVAEVIFPVEPTFC
jgi:hypothetical protein